MNAREIQNAARGFVQQMKDDVRNKLNQFLRESGLTIRQMARDLGLNEDELDRIQHGDGRVSLETFATLLIANGLVLEVKPISEAPIPTRNGVPVPPRGFDDQQRDKQWRSKSLAIGKDEETVAMQLVGSREEFLKPAYDDVLRGVCLFVVIVFKHLGSRI